MQGTGQSCPPDTASRPAGTPVNHTATASNLRQRAARRLPGSAANNWRPRTGAGAPRGLALPGGLVTQGADHAPGFVGPPLVVHGGSLVSRVRSGFTVRFRDDCVGVFGPHERLAAFVPAIDEGGDRLDQLPDGTERPAADGLPGDDPEEDLDEVQPRPRGRGEVQGDPRVPRQPGLFDASGG